VLDGEHSVAIARSGDGLDIRTPAHASGTGRVLLADLGRRERERALAAGHDGIDAEELHRSLDRVRLDGWESDDGEGMRTLAVPVRDVRGTVVAALGVAAPAPDLAPERRDEALRALRQGAEQIASELPSV
jgi:IclR family pca regulon transcriptional regulator